MGGFCLSESNRMADTDKYKQVLELSRSIKRRMDALNKIVGKEPMGEESKTSETKGELKSPEESADPGAALISLAQVAAYNTPQTRSMATKVVDSAKDLAEGAKPILDKAIAEGKEALDKLSPEVKAAGTEVLEQASNLGSVIQSNIEKVGPAIDDIASKAKDVLEPLDAKITEALKSVEPGATAAAAKAASDSMNAASAALASTEAVIQAGIKDIPADQIKEVAATAMTAVSAEAQKAAEAAAKVAEAAKQATPEIAAKAAAISKSLNEAIDKAKTAPEAALAAATLSKAITVSATGLSNVTREVATYAASLDPEAAAQLKETIGTVVSSAIDSAQIAGETIQALTQKLAPYFHTAAVAVGATSLTAAAASPALPIILAVASVVMVIMHQKKMHSKLVAKMNSYFQTLMQMAEIFRIMTIVAGRMNYAIDDGKCILALNEFKAYLYLTAPPSIRKAFEEVNENTDKSGKTKTLSWIEKTTGQLQRVFASTTITTRLQQLFDDVITSFLLTFSKFNMVTAIHSDVLASMKSEITKLDEVIKFFDKLELKPVKECSTDEECQAAAAPTVKQLEDSRKMAGVKAEDVTENLKASEKAIEKVEASPEFKQESKTKGWFNLFGSKKGGSRKTKSKGKFRTKRLPRSKSKN